MSLAALAASACPGASAPESTYQRLLEEAVAKGVPGLQTYVRRGDARWIGAAGVSSIEEKRVMTAAQPIRLASITKLMTHAAVMELVKKKRLRLSDSAVSLLPSGALDGIPNGGEIRVAHLLEHKSGLHNFNGEDGRDFFRDLLSDPNRGTRPWRPADLLVYAKKSEHRPTNRPGERVAYSSTGYIVLQMILENLEQKPLAAIYRELLFVPLEMKSSGVEGADFTAAQIADSYARPGAADSLRSSPFAERKRARTDGLVNLSAGLRYYNAWAQGAGAVAAPVVDLAKFMDAVTAGRVEVLSNQAGQFGAAKAEKKKRFAWNGGSWGIQATILFEPNRDITAIVVSNSSNAGPTTQEVALAILDASGAAN